MKPALRLTNPHSATTHYEPVADERAAVAYLDLGTGGCMDVGTDLTDEQLAALPKGRHMLAIIGTHGVNGYTPASAPVAGQAVALELRGVPKTIMEGGGFWRSCTGCHELNEGRDTGPYSAVLGCHLGQGCGECGGIGAIWDSTDYQTMADDMARDMGQSVSAAPQASAENDWKAAIRKFMDTAIPALAAIANVHTPDEIDALEAMPREPVIDQVRRLSQACEELSRQVRPERPKADKDAARCTCPSGDGSLRHPCPAHPQTNEGRA